MFNKNFARLLEQEEIIDVQIRLENKMTKLIENNLFISL